MQPARPLVAGFFMRGRMPSMKVEIQHGDFRWQFVAMVVIACAMVAILIFAVWPRRK
jgi:hypothetical protein